MRLNSFCWSFCFSALPSSIALRSKKLTSTRENMYTSFNKLLVQFRCLAFRCTVFCPFSVHRRLHSPHDSPLQQAGLAHPDNCHQIQHFQFPLPARMGAQAAVSLLSRRSCNSAGKHRQPHIQIYRSSRNRSRPESIWRSVKIIVAKSCSHVVGTW